MKLREAALGCAIVFIGGSVGGCAATTAGLWANETIPEVTPGPVVDAQTADSRMPQPNGPMWDLLGHILGTDLDPAEQARRREAEEQRRTELIVQCMLEQGFEYPVSTASAEEYQVRPDIWQPGSRDWVAQWGFGIINQPVVVDLDFQPDA